MGRLTYEQVCERLELAFDGLLAAKPVTRGQVEYVILAARCAPDSNWDGLDIVIDRIVEKANKAA